MPKQKAVKISTPKNTFCHEPDTNHFSIREELLVSLRKNDTI